MSQVSTSVSWQLSKVNLSSPCLPVGLRNPEVSLSSVRGGQEEQSSGRKGRRRGFTGWPLGLLEPPARGASAVRILTQSPTAGQGAPQSCQNNHAPWAPTATERGQEQTRWCRGKTARESERPKASYKSDAGHGARSHRLTCRQEKAHRNRFPRDPGPGRGCSGPRWDPYGEHFRQLAARVLLGH